MRLFNFRPRPVPQPAPEVESAPEVEPAPEPTRAVPPEPGDGQGISVSRTLVKSEPELTDLVASEARLTAPGVKVTMAEKGFGTRVAITAEPPADLGPEELEGLLDELAEPHKRPFSAG